MRKLPKTGADLGFIWNNCTFATEAQFELEFLIPDSNLSHHLTISRHAQSGHSMLLLNYYQFKSWPALFADHLWSRNGSLSGALELLLLLSSITNAFGALKRPADCNSTRHLNFFDCATMLIGRDCNSIFRVQLLDSIDFMVVSVILSLVCIITSNETKVVKNKANSSQNLHRYTWFILAVWRKEGSVAQVGR